jgi:hypothetical protein
VRLVGEAVEAYRAAADGQTVTTAEEPKDVRIDLPIDAHLPPEYIGSDRLRLEAYRRLAAAASDGDVRSVVDELSTGTAAAGAAARLVAVARLRLLCGTTASPRCRRRVSRAAVDAAAGATGVGRFGADPAQAGCIRRRTTGRRRRPCRFRFRGSATPWVHHGCDLELAQMVADLLPRSTADRRARST